MAKVYYIGTNGKRHGPVTEAEAQAWYASGFFSSGVKFQVTAADQAEPNGPYHTLAELIELNGRILPFYFAPEKETRESKQDATLNQLVQDVESLRASTRDSRRNEKGVNEAIAVFRSQVESLIESHEDLLRQVNALSGQKENSPVASQLEKRVSELKERIDKQEKNYASMRKELSAVTSKCDRNDTKLDRLIEKQQQVEETVTGYDKRIGDLKASETSIRDCLNACEQNAVSGSAQLQSISSDLSEIRKEIERASKFSTAHESEIDKNRKDLDEVLGRIREHSNKLSEVVLIGAALSEEIKSVKEASEKTSKGQYPVAATINPFEKAADSVPPWEKSEGGKTPVAAAVTKSDVVVEAKRKEENAPWEDEAKAGADVKKEGNRAPWDDDKSQPEPEPWNRTTTDSIGAEKPAEKGPLSDQKVKVAQATVESAAAVKPVSRVKDWNAICRELSDDEEENGHDNSAISATQSLEFSQKFARDFVATLSGYCAAMETGDFSLLRQMLSHSKCPYDQMMRFQEQLFPHTNGYGLIKNELRKELQRLADKSVYCSPCDFLMTTPYHLYQHLMAKSHDDFRHRQELALFADDFAKLNVLVSLVFYKCVCSNEQQLAWAQADISLVQHASRRAERNRADPRALHPTTAFQSHIVSQLTNFAPSAIVDGNPVEVVLRSAGDLAKHEKTRLAEVRAWLVCKKRRRQLQADFDKHMAEGTPGCGSCYLEFASANEYVLHVVSYGHALRDQSLFAMCMWAWKGSERWDAAM